MRPPLVAVALVSLLIAILAATGVAAAPPPTQICAVCGDSFEGSTDPGALDVYLEDDGDSRWVERVPIEGTAQERYRDDPALLEAAVDEAWTPSHVAGDDASEVSTAVEDGAVVVSYTVEGVASPGFGETWIVDYFYAGGSPTRYHVAGERVTLHPPDGYVVTNRPPGAHLEGGAVTWDGGDPGPMESELDRETLVTYGADDGLATTAASYGSIVGSVGPLVGRHAALVGLVPALVLAGGALAVVRLERSTGRIGRLHARVSETDPDRLGRGIAIVGIAGVVVALLAGLVQVGNPFAPGALVLAVGAAWYAGLGVVASRFSGTVETRTLVGVAVVVAIGCGITTWSIDRTTAALVPAAFTLSVAAFLPLGHALERGRGVAFVLGVALAGPFIAAAAISPVYVFGMTPAVYGLFLVPTVVLVVVAGYPFSIVGRRLAAENECVAPD